ncbi:MAG: hypothetical protein OXC54_00410, partial [Rhodospirillaceae bacterium]|nr:hypothetical protein [Rhodospirillaceae bacterium]
VGSRRSSERGCDETGRRVAGGSEQAAKMLDLSVRTLRRREERDAAAGAEGLSWIAARASWWPTTA